MSEVAEATSGPLMVSAGLLTVQVAGVKWRLEARGADVRFTVPDGHARFLIARQGEVGGAAEAHPDLVLRVQRRTAPAPSFTWQPVYRSEIWELWEDEAGRDVFVAPRQRPPRWVALDRDRRAGDVYLDARSGSVEPVYPLQGLDNIILVNLLGRDGDAMLHASGVMLGGQGYCFVGASGAGKSTLARHLRQAHGATVLGEDQVILRYLDGRFWIYGTPWHEDPAFCAPERAPLAKVFFLDRTAQPGVRPLSSIDGVARLMQTAFIPYYRPEAVGRILDRLALLAEQVPFLQLSYRLGDDVKSLIL